MSTLSLSQSVRSIYKKIKKIDELLNIIEFCESPSGLNIKLYPVQKFILRVFYSLDLSDDISDDPILIYDDFNEKLIRTFNSEIDFFHFLYSEQRINVSYDEWRENGEFLEIIFVIGRRGSKTTMTSLIGCYTLYVVLSLEDPHRYFGIMESDSIGIALVSNHGDNAAKQYMAISELITRSTFFQKYLATSNGEELWLMSEAFKALKEEDKVAKKGNILVTSFTASPSVRGSSNIMVVMDEFDHFKDADSSHVKDKRLAERVYEALVPSISGFVDPNNGKAVGKSFVISSPNGKKGELYKLYKASFEDKGTLMLNMPSWWVNRRVASQVLRSAYIKSERSFRQEFGAEFIDKMSNWVTESVLDSAFNIGNSNLCRASDPTARYYVGLDLAFTHDRCPIAVGRLSDTLPSNYQPFIEGLRVAEEGPYYIIDHVKVFKPEDESGGEIKIEGVIEYLDFMCRNSFRVIDGSFDQYNGAALEQLLAKKPHIRLHQEAANVYNNSSRAMLMKKILNERRLILPYDSEIRDEFRELQEVILKDKGVKVCNDAGHDDIYCAISRAVEKIYINEVVNGGFQPRANVFARGGGIVNRNDSRMIVRGADGINYGNPSRASRMSNGVVRR